MEIRIMLHPKFSLFILLSTIQIRMLNSKVATISAAALNCSDGPFNCGTIAYIAYPFWGGLRSSECGRQGFEIICKNNIPIINISSLSYQVLKLDFVTNTLTVARQDLQGTYCPHPLRNTTIDSDLFRYPPNSTDRDITLYFDCTALQPEPLLSNNFTCANHTSNLFKIGFDPSSPSPSPSSGIVCGATIYVPINKEDAESLQNPTPSSINTLRSALDAGFSIQWFNDTKQGTADFCNRNIYGSCFCTFLEPCRRGRVGNEDGTPVSSPNPTPMPPLPTPAHAPSNALSLVPTAGIGKNTTQDNNG